MATTNERRSLKFKFQNWDIEAAGVPPFTCSGRVPRIYDAVGRTVYIEINGCMNTSICTKGTMDAIVRQMNEICKAETKPEIAVVEADHGDEQPSLA